MGWKAICRKNHKTNERDSHATQRKCHIPAWATQPAQLAAHSSPRRSAKSGTDLSMPARACGTIDCATREFAKDLPRDGEHSRPPPSPTKERRPLKGGWGVPCSWYNQIFNKLNCFWAPSSPSLHGHNHKTAPVTREEL